MRPNSSVFGFSGKNCCERAIFFSHEVISRGLLSKFVHHFNDNLLLGKSVKKVTLVYHYSTGAKGKMT